MIDYYETKSQPITRVMVLKAYQKVRSNKGGMGIDKMDWKELDNNLSSHIYKLWNRMSSGSYFPQAVQSVKIQKKDGGERELGVPTILDRIAQEVVRVELERKVEPLFHNDSYGYRKGRNAHQAIKKATENAYRYNWAIDLDIKGFFDNIDHDLLLKAVSHYCNDKWILLYIERWLKVGIMDESGQIRSRINGTPQGGVISPLLANIYLHVVFDKWMAIYHPSKPFERYADDIVVHCKTENQAIYLKDKIQQRLKSCKLDLHPLKTKIVHFRGPAYETYPRSLDFLGFTLRLHIVKTTKGLKLMTTSVISRKSVSAILRKFRAMKIHKIRGNIIIVSRRLSSIIRGLKNYFCKFWSGHTYNMWYHLNGRLLKWVKWEKGLSPRAARRWLQLVYKKNPGLFPHWELVHP